MSHLIWYKIRRALQDEDAEFFDKTGRRIFASTGGVTKVLRDAWLLHPDVVLDLPSSNNGEKRKGKDRSDHRHHAVDALVIALTTEQQIRAVNLHAASKQDKKWPLDYRDIVKGLKSPWDNRDQFVGNVFHQILVSHKPEHKLAGCLHKDSNYGKIRDTTAKDKPIVYQRIFVDSNITSNDVANIVDKNVRKSVSAMEQSIGGFTKWSMEKHGYPTLTTKQGYGIPIKKVRISRTKETATIGSGRAGGQLNAHRSFDTRRHVDASEKNHVAVFVSRTKTTKAKRPKEKWVSECVSVLEAHGRHNAGQPTISKQYGKDIEATFLFSLRKGDVVELGPEDHREHYILTAIEADGRINFVPINAAGKRTAQVNVKVREMADGLRPLNLKKVFVDLLGIPHFINESAND